MSDGERLRASWGRTRPAVAEGGLEDGQRWELIFFFSASDTTRHNPHPDVASDFQLSPGLSAFTLPSPSGINELIHKSKSSSCHLDALPTVLVRAYLPSLLHLIADLINSSLATGITPI